MKVTTAPCILAITFTAVCSIASCAKKDETPAPNTPSQGYAPNGYPTGAPTAYPTAAPVTTGYPGAPTGYPPAPAPTAPAPGAPAAAAPGQMATPGPLALPCQNDSSCGLAHCNVQFQKCAFPCQSATDCIQGSSCNTMSGLCLPFAQ
jgi:hypothetical protein